MNKGERIKTGEASKILQRHRVTLLGYEERGLLHCVREPLTNDRLFSKEEVEKLARRINV